MAGNRTLDQSRMSNVLTSNKEDLVINGNRNILYTQCTAGS